MPKTATATDAGADAVETAPETAQDVVVEEVPTEDGVSETLTYYGPPEPEGDPISLDGLQLAEFYGRQGQANEATQKHVTALEDFLRSHAVGGSNRTSEGFYGDKTRALVNAAYDHYLGKEGNGTVGRDLIEALRSAGALVTG